RALAADRGPPRPAPWARQHHGVLAPDLERAADRRGAGAHGLARGCPPPGPPPALADGRPHAPDLPDARGTRPRARERGQPHQRDPHPRPVREPGGDRLGDDQRVPGRAVLPGRRAQDPLRPDAVRDHPPRGDAMTLLLTRSDVAELLTLDECIAARAHAFPL